MVVLCYYHNTPGIIFNSIKYVKLSDFGYIELLKIQASSNFLLNFSAKFQQNIIYHCYTVLYLNKKFECFFKGTILEKKLNDFGGIFSLMYSLKKYSTLSPTS